MNRSKTVVEQIISILDERLHDIVLLTQSDYHHNIMSVIEGINDKQNQRLRQLSKLQLLANQTLREQTNELLTEIGRYLHESSMKIFHKIHKGFKIEPLIKFQNIKFILLFRKYFIEINDIRMMAKLDEMFKNKALKKTIVLTKLLKLLADIVKENLYDTLRVANTNLTQYQIDEYYKHKKDVLKQLPLDGIMESKISRNMLAIRPIFMIQSFSRSQQIKGDQVKLGNFKKLKEKWQERLSKKQNDRAVIKLNTQVESKRTISGTATPMQSLMILTTLKQSNIEQLNTVVASPSKSQSAPIIEKTLTVKFRHSQDRIIINKNSCESTKIGFKDYSGIGDFKQIYGLLNLQQKHISKVFLKKSRRYYPEMELKLRLQRNNEVQKQISLYRKKS